MRIPRIVITPGEPAGIGPDITLQIAQQEHSAELVVVADPELLSARAKLLGLPITLNEFNIKKTTRHQRGTITIVPVSLNETCIPGKLNAANSSYVIQSLELATDLCLRKEADALVTGPVQKSILMDAEINFSGHTEFLAHRCGVSCVIMLFVTAEMKVALATTHLPLADVPKAITQIKLVEKVRLLNSELKKRFGLKQPAILICGLNPHAGEHGHLGREEIEIIQPAVRELVKDKINVIGPLPADTIFTEKYLQSADAILAMYHDQALPVVKYLGFGQVVNVTLGLPIIRTSVDHGTALDIAGTLKADPASLLAAINLATKIC